MNDAELTRLEAAATAMGDKLVGSRLTCGHQALHASAPLSHGDLDFLQEVGPTVLALTAEVRRLTPPATTTTKTETNS